jgi:hypothetical protein
MNKEAIAKVVHRLAIQQVYAAQISLKTNDGYIPAIGDLTTSQLYWGTKDLRLQSMSEENGNTFNIAKIRFGTLAKILRIKIDAEIPADYVPDPADILAEIEITFVADYLVIGEEPIDQEGAGQFALHNAPYHIWPYWREYLQQLASRANLPVPTLPFYQVGQQQLGNIEVSDTTAQPPAQK